LGDIDKVHRTVYYAGRDYSASPAVGHMKLHLQQQSAVIESALGFDHQKKVKLRKQA
jgi:2-oxoglutarate dehydrogenase complex dehydrogenase (E1) component-like enzyme